MKKTVINIIMFILFFVILAVGLQYLNPLLVSTVLFIYTAILFRNNKELEARFFTAVLFLGTLTIYIGSLRQGSIDVLNWLGYQVHKFFPTWYSKVGPYASAHKQTYVVVTMVGITIALATICAAILFIKIYKKCDFCDGWGFVLEDDPQAERHVTCPVCKGRKKINKH